jgi:rod shape determining protein RodA
MAFAETRSSFRSERLTIGEKLGAIRWGLVFLISFAASIGFAMLYSAANGSFEPWAWRQMVRFAVGLVLMLSIALIDIRVWLRYAYLLYAIALALLVAVEILGFAGMGARRWIDLGVFQLQPSEVMKIALVLALARYYQGLTLEDTRRMVMLIIPILLVFAPAVLVLRQPDLGTAVLLIMTSGAVIFLAGVRLRMFAAGLVVAVGALPVGWQFLREYQRERVYSFLDPESDPLGAGYHILQSKIALGSGGVFGKGFLGGSQSHLNFLPETQTDFIFTMLAEEFGLVGGLVLIVLYALILCYCIAISLRSTSQFGRLTGMGITTAFFLYVFINIAMVTGLVPVVGVPLPLVSYGGTAMMTILVGFGLILGVYVHRDVTLPRRPGAAR